MTTRGLHSAIVLFLGTVWCGSGPLAAQNHTSGVAVFTDSGVARAAVLATNSVHLSAGVHVTGNVVANAASTGATLVAGREVAIDKPAVVTGDVFGDSVGLAKGVIIAGSVAYNELFDSGATISGGTSTPLALPVLAPLPRFQEAAIRPGAPDVTVGSGQTVTLEPGDYGDIRVAQFGTLIFAGGLYDARSLGVIVGSETCNDPCRSLLFSGAAEVRLAGRLESGRAANIGPTSGSGVSAAEIVFYVGGENGGDGGPAASPAAVAIGRESVLAANVYAPHGRVEIDRNSHLTGALLARDVQIDSNSTLVRDSFVANLAPVAQPGTAYTSGAAAIDILLQASDPEGEDVTFSIVSGPALGSLGPVVESPAPFPGDPPGCNPENVPGCVPPDPPRTTATVSYTPPAGDDVEDSFVFAAIDPHGAAGTATVRINPPEPPTPPPPPLDTVLALDAFFETAVELPVEVVLTAAAPDGVSLTFSISNGPAHGTLGALTQGGESPQRSARVVYTPATGFAGFDSFGFEACGVIDSVSVCDQAVATVSVAGALADDQELVTSENTEVTVFLTGTAGAGGAGALRNVHGNAAFLDGAEVAGNVADATGDGLGDNHNALPGSAPNLMSAGVDLTGGAGSNGTVRMHIEWDISALGGLADSLESAQVILSTQRGTTDALDTFFFVGAADGNGALDDADFELPADQIPGVVMPVPDVPVGTDGTFSFDVTRLLREALGSDRHAFVVQGRVDESPANATQRGLQVRTTASGNLLDHSEPQLAIATPGVTPPALTFSVVSLPSNGTLRDSLGAIIGSVPFTLGDQVVRYTPNVSFVGADAFTFQVEDLFSNSAIATVSISVLALADPCAFNGREPGCLP